MCLVRPIWLLWATLACTVPPVAAAAQSASADWAAFTSTKEINSVLVDSGGVWTATNGGVLRFDLATQNYKRFTRLNGLAGNKVFSAAVDDRGHVWFGTDQKGLSRLRPDEDAFDRPFVDFNDLKINTLVADGDRLYVGMDRGVSLFLVDKEEVKETYRILGSFTKDTPVTELAVLNGRLWVGTREGVAWADMSLPNLQDPDSWTVNAELGQVRDFLVWQDTLFIASSKQISTNAGDGFDIDFVRNNIFHLGVFDGSVAAANSDGTLFTRTDGRWTVDRSQAFPGITDLSKSDSVLWVGTDRGLQVKGTEPPPPPQEPGANQFYDIALNGDELWIASVPNDQGLTKFGVYQFDGTNWEIHTEGKGFLSNDAVSPQADADGNVWVGTWGKGIGVFVNGLRRKLASANSALGGIGSSRSFIAISDIVRDDDGLMWIANVLIGLVVMDGYPPRQQLLYDNETIGLPGARNVGKIAIAADGVKWVSTPRDGFLLFDDGGTPFVAGDEFSVLINDDYDSRLTSNRTSDILVDATGQVWVGTDNGLNAVRTDYSREGQTLEIVTWRVYNASNGLPSGIVNAVEADDQGNVWVGSDAGLTQIGPDGEIVVTLTTLNSGLINNRVNSLRFNGESGELWIGTLDGLARLQVLSNGGNSKVIGSHTYPNPFYPSAGARTITLTGLPLGAAVRIFSLDGTQVKEIAGEPGRGTAEWDGRNAAGWLVGSGIYYFVAENDVGKHVVGKFALVNGL